MPSFRLDRTSEDVKRELTDIMRTLKGPENQRAFEHFKSGFEQRFIAVPGICQFFGRYRRGEIRS